MMGFDPRSSGSIGRHCDHYSHHHHLRGIIINLPLDEIIAKLVDLEAHLDPIEVTFLFEIFFFQQERSGFVDEVLDPMY